MRPTVAALIHLLVLFKGSFGQHSAHKPNAKETLNCIKNKCPDKFYACFFDKVCMKSAKCVQDCDSKPKDEQDACRVQCLAHLKDRPQLVEGIFDCSLEKKCIQGPPLGPPGAQVVNCNPQQDACSGDASCWQWRKCVGASHCRTFDIGCLSECEAPDYKPDNSTLMLTYCSMKTKQQIIVPANAPAESPEAAAGGSSGRAGSGSVPSSDGASKKKINTLAWVFGGLGIAFAALGSIYFVKRSFCKRNTETLHELVGMSAVEEEDVDGIDHEALPAEEGEEEETALEKELKRSEWD
eukprot:jgi/Bigna1/89831/estExt_fgenesh1_pg.C_560078